MTRALKNRKTRAWIYQAVVLVTVVGLTASFVLIARQNLLDQGIATGFGFLERSTGWPINFALIEVTPRSPYWRMLTAGLLNTLLVGFLGLAFATVVGIVVGLIRISSNLVLNVIGTTYVEIFRNVPLILQAFFWYAVLTHLPSPRQAIPIGDIAFLSNRGLILPALDMSAVDILGLVIGIGVVIYGVHLARRAGPPVARFAWPVAAIAMVSLFTVLLLTGRTPDAALMTFPELRGLRFVGGVDIKPEFTALLIAITVFGGAYIGEIVRGGLLSVDRGRIEAARALGLNGFQINRLVRIPLAVRAMLPALANQYVWLMKATTIGIAIGFPDYFMVVSTSINQSGQTMELLALLMGGFLLVNYSIGFVMNRVNARLAIKGKSS
jgi:His/Glu/Gln/Arg/opine family amino acid ABC transporter permease subunit